MSRLFRLVQSGADPYTVDLLITDWDGAHDARMARSGPLPRVYLQLYELDRDGANDDLGRIELSILGVWDFDDARQVRARYFVEDPRYVPPSGDRETGDFLRVRLPLSDPDRAPTSWFEQWIPLRKDEGEADERTYQVDFTIKQGRQGELLAPLAPGGSGRARQLRHRRVAAIPPGGRPDYGPHPGCLVPALRRTVEEFREQVDSLRAAIRENHQRVALCEYVVQLATQGVDDLWDHFQTFRSAADARREAAARRRQIEDASRAIESAADVLRRRWTDAENDLLNHHDVAERMELGALFSESGFLATDTGTDWAVSSRGAHPTDGRLWELLSWGNVRRFPTFGSKIMDQVYPAWVRLSPSDVVTGTRLRVGSFFEGDPGPRGGLGPGVELIEEIRSDQWEVNTYRINPSIRGLYRGLQHVNALLRVAALVATLAKLRESGAGANRQTVDAAGQTIGTAGSLYSYARFLRLSATAREAGASVSTSTALTRACSRVSTAVGVGLALWDGYDNLREDDVDAAWCNVLMAVGVVCMEVPHPYAIVAGLVMCAAAAVGGVLLEDSELQQWALHGPYGRSPRHDPARSLRDVQVWIVSRTLHVTTVVEHADRDGASVVIEAHAARDVTDLELSLEARATDGGWRATRTVDLTGREPVGTSVSWRDDGGLRVVIRFEHPAGGGQTPYSVQGALRLIAGNLEDPETGRPTVLRDDSYFQATGSEVGTPELPDGGIGGG